MERCCEGYGECSRLAERCDVEVESLKDEKKQLMGRLRDIDSDIVKVCVCVCGGLSQRVKVCVRSIILVLSWDMKEVEQLLKY